jgi:hypothetical protein
MESGYVIEPGKLEEEGKRSQEEETVFIFTPA